MTSRFTTAAAKILNRNNENQHANRQFQLNHKNCTVWCKSQNIRKRHIVFVQLNPEMNVILQILEIQRKAYRFVRSIPLPVQNIRAYRRNSSIAPLNLNPLTPNDL
jgi:uncharacterized protein (DUF849 family)